MKKREKWEKNEPSLTSMRQMILEIQHSGQEFEQDGRGHILGFQSLFHFNMTSQTQSSKTIKNESAVSQESFV